MQKGVVTLHKRPSVLAAGSVVGKKEMDGPMAALFDRYDMTDTFGKPTWEQSESEMQRIAFNTAMEKGGFDIHGIDAIFAGDLINQCTSSGYGLCNFDARFFGIFGACSTMAEGLVLASMLTDAGIYERCAAVTSSHNCTAERQFRNPLEYGGQRTPTAQWTVTGSAAVIVGAHTEGEVSVTEVLPGRIVDKGITDQANMGAAMAPSAVDTLKRYFDETGRQPSDFSAIFTGDLGYEGSGILCDLLAADGCDISSVHRDCGLLIYDREGQDVHAGGSGCGCAATVLAAYILPALKSGRMKEVLFMATGALMNTASIQQGLTIPGIAHLVHFSSEGIK